jgi:SAM-dependent methyltransferase
MRETVRPLRIGLERSLNELVRWRRGVGKGALMARQIVAYHVPGESACCPSCGSRAITHLEPLAFPNAPAVGWRVGFISGCTRCGLLFANPTPTMQALDEIYSDSGDWGRSRQDEHEDRVSRGRLEELFAPMTPHLDAVHPPQGARVLDFGCGLGGMLDSLAEHGWITAGIDPATKVAFRRHREYLEVPDEPQFDLVILHHVLEHVTEPLAILQRLARATRPGGFILISVPNLDAASEHGEKEYCIRSRIHVTAYSTRALEWLCARTGFRVMAARGDGRDSRRQVVVARREVEPVAGPDDPLAAAKAALEAYGRRHPSASAPLRAFPVRVRAAAANLSRLGRHRAQ